MYSWIMLRRRCYSGTSWSTVAQSGSPWPLLTRLVMKRVDHTRRTLSPEDKLCCLAHLAQSFEDRKRNTEHFHHPADSNGAVELAAALVAVLTVLARWDPGASRRFPTACSTVGHSEPVVVVVLDSVLQEVAVVLPLEMYSTASHPAEKIAVAELPLEASSIAVVPAPSPVAVVAFVPLLDSCNTVVVCVEFVLVAALGLALEKYSTAVLPMAAVELVNLVARLPFAVVVTSFVDLVAAE